MGGGEHVNSILNTCFLIYGSFEGDFCTEKIIFFLKKKQNSQVLNKPQMRLLLKISGGTFYQIQAENSALLQRIDSKPLTDRIYVFEYSTLVTKT